jgi:glycosyltransferase involved in cell wall biosynthesis
MRLGGVLPTESLVLSPESPYPLTGGGALRTASLLHCLATRGPVDLIVFRQPEAAYPGQALPAGLVRKITVIDLPAHSRGGAARAARNAGRVARQVPPLVDRFAGFEREVSAAIGAARYQVGVVEHSWCAPYAGVLGLSCERLVLDLHNIESLLHQRCAAVEGGMTGLAHRLFADASLELERRWLPQFSQVLAPSRSDAEWVRAIAPSANVVVYPNAIPAMALPAHADEEVIAFSGNMEYHPNQGAVRFFRQEVWPQLREQWPRLIWRLIGKNPGAVRKWISGDARIEATGPIGDAVRELARCRVAVVPLLAASGTRLKILEAWAAGLPVVSTPIGAEGLQASDGQNLLLAEGGTAFAAAVSRLLVSPALRRQLGAAGRALLEQEFTWEKAWKKLDF